MSIGEIGVSVTTDIAQFTDGMNRTAQIAETSMRRVEQAQRIATAASDKFLSSLKFQADTIGKTDIEILRYKANLLGTSSAAKPLIDQIEAMAKAAGNATGSLRSSGSEAQTAGGHIEGFSFKTAGAKRELLVLAHELSQGNFSKFGGSLLVLGERTGAAALLFNPLTIGVLVAVAALGSFAFAAFKGAEESEALAKSLQLTGNFAGITSSQFNSMAQTIAAGTTHQVGAARDALAALVSTGKFTATALVPLGQASIDISRLTGKTAEEVAKDFEQMKDGVAQYASKLNDSYHFLSAAQFEHIRQLENQGKAQEAMAETGRVIDTALKNNDTNLGYLDRALQGAKRDWDRFWDAAHDTGREDTTSKKIERAQSALESAQAGLSARSTLPNLAKMYTDDVEGKRQYVESLNRQLLREIDAGISKGAEAERQAAGIKASQDLEKFHKQYAAKSQQAAAEIALYKKAIADRIAAGEGGVDSEKQQQTMIAAIRQKYAEPPKEHQDSAATKFLQNLREQDAVIKEQLQDATNLTGAQKEQAKFEQLLTDLKGKKLTKDQESLLAGKDAIRAQLAKNVSDAEELRVKGEIQKLDEKSVQINAQIASFRGAQKEGYQLKLDSIGTGKDAQSQIAEITRISKEFRKEQDELLKQTPAEFRGSDKFLSEQARIKSEMEASLNDYTAYFSALKEKQGDWRNGATQAFADYRDNAENVAGQVESALTGAFRSAEDAFVAFVTTGKLSFSSLATSIVADIARIQAKKALAGLGGLALDALGLGLGISDAQVETSHSDGMAYMNNQLNGYTPPRASGGPVWNGQSFLVGERGPEIFTPSSAGTIIPNGSGAGGGAVTVNMEMNFAEGGTSSTTSGDSHQQAKAFGETLTAKVREVIAQERRQGGQLWNMQLGRG